MPAGGPLGGVAHHAAAGVPKLGRREARHRHQHGRGEPDPGDVVAGAALRQPSDSPGAHGEDVSLPRRPALGGVGRRERVVEAMGPWRRVAVGLIGTGITDNLARQ